MLAKAQSYSEKISKEYTFEKKSTDNAVVVANLNGNVRIVGYEGDKIILEVNKTVSGKTEARLEKGKQELKLGTLDLADTLVFYVEDGCNSFGKAHQRNKNVHSHQSDWGYHWNCDHGNCHQEYDYNMDFVLKVPATVNLIVSTINDGDIHVEKINGAVKAHNINGSIRLVNLTREANASTINGDVDIEYSNNPQKDCRFYSLNGDINALFEKGLAADLSFESFNGNFYTNVVSIEPLPARVEKTSHGKGIQYKVNGNRYQLGKGGIMLDFETFNGNVYLKEK